MKIAIASGKGGTGKTTVTVNLALALLGDTDVTVLDCDVEEPNSRHFLDIDFNSSNNETISIPQPFFDEATCTHCRACAQFCQYHAIAVLSDRVMFFPELCNGCGGCTMTCPVNAITEISREVGSIRGGSLLSSKTDDTPDGSLSFLEGQLNPGEAKAVPVISALKKHAGPLGGITLLDSSPGTSCPVLETIRDTDFCILVTEPTPFGLHDLKLAVAAIAIVQPKSSAAKKGLTYY